MRIETCRVGGALRLDGGTRIEIFDRLGERIVLGITAPTGTDLTLGGARVRPIPARIGVWQYLFSLGGCRRFALGRDGAALWDVHVWLPGELVPLAADCLDWVHVGVTPGPGETAPPHGAAPAALPGAVVLAGPWPARRAAPSQSRSLA